MQIYYHDPKLDRGITPQRVFEIFEIPTAQLAKWRKTGEGPDWIRLGSQTMGEIRYPLVRLRNWYIDVWQPKLLLEA